MKAKLWIKVLYGIGIASLLAASFFAGQQYFHARAVQASGAPSSASSPDSPTAAFTCTSISTIAIYTNRMHIRCSVSNGGVLYYALPTTDANLNRFLAVGNTAYTLGGAVGIWYDTDPSHNPPGCGTADCRLLLGLESL